MTKQKPNLRETILRTVFFFIAWFFIAAIISYFTLPDGILRSSNEAKDVSEQSSFLAFVFSIVIRNLIPAIGLCIGCLAAIRIRNCNYPFAYLGLFTMFTINGVTLGTWSFSVTHEAVPGLFPRLLRTFDLLHRAGLWEMVGMCLLVAALTNAAIVQISDGKPVIDAKNFKLTKSEILCLVCGFLLLVVAAVVESNAVITRM